MEKMSAEAQAAAEAAAEARTELLEEAHRQFGTNNDEKERSVRNFLAAHYDETFERVEALVKVCYEGRELSDRQVEVVAKKDFEFFYNSVRRHLLQDYGSQPMLYYLQEALEERLESLELKYRNEVEARNESWKLKAVDRILDYVTAPSGSLTYPSISRTKVDKILADQKEILAYVTSPPPLMTLPSTNNTNPRYLGDERPPLSGSTIRGAISEDGVTLSEAPPAVSKLTSALSGQSAVLDDISRKLDHVLIKREAANATLREIDRKAETANLYLKDIAVKAEEIAAKTGANAETLSKICQIMSNMETLANKYMESGGSPSGGSPGGAVSEDSFVVVEKN